MEKATTATTATLYAGYVIQRTPEREFHFYRDGAQAFEGVAGAYENGIVATASPLSAKTMTKARECIDAGLQPQERHYVVVFANSTEEAETLLLERYKRVQALGINPYEGEYPLNQDTAHALADALYIRLDEAPYHDFGITNTLYGNDWQHNSPRQKLKKGAENPVYATLVHAAPPDTTIDAIVAIHSSYGTITFGSLWGAEFTFTQEAIIVTEKRTIEGKTHTATGVFLPLKEGKK